MSDSWDVLVVDALSDLDAPRVHDAIRRVGFTILSLEAITSRRTRAEVLLESLALVESVVVVVPPPGNRSRANVLFEAGAAVGSGKPILLVGSSKLPTDLLDFPYLPLENLKNIRSAVLASRDAARIMEYKIQTPSIQAGERILKSPSVDVFPSIASPYAELSERELVFAVQSALSDDESRVVAADRVGGQRGIEAPDLVLWNDELLSGFGLPIPVEVLRNYRNWRGLLPRMRRILEASGARSLIAVGGQGPRNIRWSSENELILFVTIDNLVEAVENGSVADALMELLAGAAP